MMSDFKRFISFALVFSLILLCSCSSEQHSNKTNTAVYDTIVFNDGLALAGLSYGVIDLERLASLSRLTIEHKTFLRDETVLKILAEDDDIDIYIMSADELSQVKEKGFSYVIESEIISDFNNGCFDYLKEFCSNDNGDIVAMPVSATFSGLVCPSEAVEEIGFSAEDIMYYDDFITLLSDYSGDRKSYCVNISPFYQYQYQYEKYYCDFENGIANYDTELYKKLYRTLEGWQRYGQEPGSPKYFNNWSGNEYDTSSVLFSFASLNSFLYEVSDNEVYKWRAFQTPKISQEVESTYANAYFAVINPHSKNKDAAVKALETVAENYFDVLGYYGKYSMIRTDKSEYPTDYLTDSAIFNDFLTIAQNSFLAERSLFSDRNDIDMYQRGEITLDEAIAMYQREVEIWLNE